MCEQQLDRKHGYKFEIVFRSIFLYAYATRSYLPSNISTMVSSKEEILRFAVLKQKNRKTNIENPPNMCLYNWNIITAIYYYRGQYVIITVIMVTSVASILDISIYYISILNCFFPGFRIRSEIYRIRVHNSGLLMTSPFLI